MVGAGVNRLAERVEEIVRSVRGRRGYRVEISHERACQELGFSGNHPAVTTQVGASSGIGLRMPRAARAGP